MGEGVRGVGGLYLLEINLCFFVKGGGNQLQLCKGRNNTSAIGAIRRDVR